VYSCPDLAAFVKDMDYMSELLADGELKSYSYRYWCKIINRARMLTNVVFSIVRRRLVLLGARFQMHNHLNEVDELKAQKKVSHRNKTNTHSVAVHFIHNYTKKTSVQSPYF
jgi:hypothetical protein